MEDNKLYREVLVSDRKPPEDGYYFIKCPNIHSGHIEDACEYHDGDFYLPEDKGYPSDEKKIISWLEKYTPPTPLESEQLEELIDKKIEDFGYKGTEAQRMIIQSEVFNFWNNTIKPHLSAMLQQKDEKIKQLENWKESAIAVTPPLQEIAKALKLKLGGSIHDKILPGILSLQSQLRQNELEIEEMKKSFNELYERKD